MAALDTSDLFTRWRHPKSLQAIKHAHLDFDGAHEHLVAGVVDTRQVVSQQLPCRRRLALFSNQRAGGRRFKQLGGGQLYYPIMIGGSCSPVAPGSDHALVPPGTANGCVPEAASTKPGARRLTGLPG
jgi:hypothetical protein